MKKFGLFIRNLYRITLVKSTGKKYTQVVRSDEYENDDREIRSIIQNDPDTFDPDPEIGRILSQMVASKKRQVSENSLAGIFSFVFSIRNIELKMAVISFVLIVSLGINPTGNYQVSRKISPFSLADTLKDTIKMDPQFFEHTSEER